MKEKKLPRTDDAYGHLMKYGPDPNHWNEYIFCAFSGYQHEAIFSRRHRQQGAAPDTGRMAMRIAVRAW